MKFDLSRCRLYGILDLGYVEAARARDTARAMIDGGVDVIQLRAKNVRPETRKTVAREVHAITHPANTPLVINDYPQLAREIDAEGVHVGQDDLSVADARAIVGEERFVGKSTHSLAQATAAATEGADYIGFGPLFATPTKPDYAPIGMADVARAHKLVDLPIFCIGGIKLENLPQIIAAGARRVVIVSGLLQANDIAEYARSAKALLVAADR